MRIVHVSLDFAVTSRLQFYLTPATLHPLEISCSLSTERGWEQLEIRSNYGLGKKGSTQKKFEICPLRQYLFVIINPNWFQNITKTKTYERVFILVARRKTGSN
jgi:hypothetical protein